MKRLKTLLTLGGLMALGGLLIAEPASAQETAEAASTAVPADGIFVFNTLLFLIGGFLVMWMAAGFAMLEAGLVRSKNVTMQCTKNIALYSVAGLMFWVVGYNLMYDGVDGGYLGSFAPKLIPEPASETADAGYAAASDWFFQMVFCATAASIVSGTVAERIKIWPFIIFVIVLTGFIYPIQGAWNGVRAGSTVWASGLRRFHAGALDRWLGRTRGCGYHRRAQGQVRPRRSDQPHARLEPAACHARHIHPVAGLVRL